MNEVLEKIQKIGIVPVVVLDDAKDAAPLAKALCEGGLPCAEVTFRTAAAEESIRIMAKEFPEMLVGAGTVLTTVQVDRAVNAGAKFIVSPGLNPTVVKYCVRSCHSFDHVDSASLLSREEFNNIKAKGDRHLNIARIGSTRRC